MNDALSRTPLNYVKMLVRESALDLREFSVEEMVKATNCKRTSVQNELRHMLDDKYLMTTPSSGPHQRRGKPASIYRLTDDAQKIEELIQEVRRFRPRRDPGPRTLGRNYELARDFLDRAGAAPEAERKALLATADNLLQAAWADQGGTGKVDDAFFKYQQGRLLFLRKDYEPAGRLLQEAAETFGRHKGYAVEQATAWQHFLSNVLESSVHSPVSQSATMKTGLLKGRMEAIKIRRRATTALRNAAEVLSSIDIGSPSENPLLRSLTHTLERVVESISPRAQLVNTAWSCLSAEGVTAEPIRHEPWRYESVNYCGVKFEESAGRIRVIRGEPVVLKSRHRATALTEIELAVRGPVHPSRLASVRIAGLKSGKLE